MITKEELKQNITIDTAQGGMSQTCDKQFLDNLAVKYGLTSYSFAEFDDFIPMVNREEIQHYLSWNNLQVGDLKILAEATSNALYKEMADKDKRRKLSDPPQLTKDRYKKTHRR